MSEDGTRRVPGAVWDWERRVGEGEAVEELGRFDGAGM